MDLNGATPALEVEMFLAFVLPAFLLAEVPDEFAAALIIPAGVEVYVAAHAVLRHEVVARDALAFKQNAFDAFGAQHRLKLSEDGVELQIGAPGAFGDHIELPGDFRGRQESLRQGACRRRRCS